MSAPAPLAAPLAAPFTTTCKDLELGVQEVPVRRRHRVQYTKTHKVPAMPGIACKRLTIKGPSRVHDLNPPEGARRFILSCPRQTYVRPIPPSAGGRPGQRLVIKGPELKLEITTT